MSANRCGLCVHRNGADETPIAACKPWGDRRRDDAVCGHFYSKVQPIEQARLANAQAKRLAAINVEDLY